MLEWLKELRQEWPQMKTARYAVFLALAIGCVIGFGSSEFFGSHELGATREDRDLYAHCLETGILTLQCANLARNAPKPQPITKFVTVPVPDPNAASTIARLTGQLDEANAVLTKLASLPRAIIRPPSAPVTTKAIPSAPVTATGTNGVAAGHIDTFTQNNAAGVPVKDRTACVAGLQKFYMSVDPILYEPLPKGIADKDLKIWMDKANAWIQSAANWINENLGAAALSKLQDQTGISVINWGRAANDSHNGAINLLSQYKANIKDMMLSNAWDDASAKCAH